MTKEQADAFAEILQILYDEKVLPYVIIVGSWAEYLYEQSGYFSTDFRSNLRTRDVDVLYSNIKMPGHRTTVIRNLAEHGFIYNQDVVSGVGKFSKEDLIDLEFMTKVLGSGNEQFYDIPSIGIKAEGLRALNILADKSTTAEFRGLTVNVPEPSAYVLQKLIINPNRTPDWKKEKDIDAVRELLSHIKNSEHDRMRLRIIYDGLSTKNKKTVDKVCKEHWLELFS
ncbi:MAG: nucleotidyltransferase domain-containing protein [Oscillospiraceae bacterium]|nr:nucleotidyltransferase domain-containing protein [Oscillospiraceae bacterium]